MALMVTITSNAFLDTVSFDLGGSYMGGSVNDLFNELVLGEFPSFEGEKYVAAYLSMFNDNELLADFYEKFKALKLKRNDLFIFIEPVFDYEDIYEWVSFNKPDWLPCLSSLAEKLDNDYDEDDD